MDDIDEFLSIRAFQESVKILKFRERIKDKTLSERIKKMYDAWVAGAEYSIIFLAVLSKGVQWRLHHE
jgi:hypothetical protein